MSRPVKRVKRRHPPAPPPGAVAGPRPAAEPHPAADPPLSARRMRRLFPGIGNRKPALDEVIRSANPLIPPRTVARRTLLALIAIMSFLACLSIAAISLVGEKSRSWQRQIAEEVTIQVRPTSGGNLDELVARAVEVALQVPGVSQARPISAADGAALLEPWLGSDFDASALPIPRLIAVQVASGADLKLLDERLRADVSGATLDDHGLWLGRLADMAGIVIIVGAVIVGLVLTATALSIVFATRGAMAANRNVIEVLHFIGAEDTYIASEFQRHFLLLGLKGAAMGFSAAAFLFLTGRLLTGLGAASMQEAQIRSIFGGFQIGLAGYLGAAIIAVVIAFAVALTARMTVQRTIAELG